MTAKEYVYTALTTDGALTALGFGPSNVWHSQTIDETPPDSSIINFILITFRDSYPGLPTQRGPMRSREQLVDFFVYSRNRDWNVVTRALARLASLADEIVAVKTGNDAADGYISTVTWTGETGDGYDQVYEAMNRIGGWNMMMTGA